MTQKLSISNIKFLRKNELQHFDINSADPDGEMWYIIECDLMYDSTAHDFTNDLSLAPEHLEVTPDMLSEAALILLQKLNKKQSPKQTKLIPNVQDKSNYITHYKNLQFYLSHGMKLSKIHKILQFKQEAWISPYIEFNSQKQRESSSAFEKQFYKTIVNSLYGKTCEQLRNRLDVRIVSKHISVERYIAKPNFHSFKIINDSLMMLLLSKTAIHWTKPTFIGAAVLDLSKLHMYQFHYDHMMKRYGLQAL